MNFKFSCPYCGQRIGANEAMAGMLAPCPHCHKVLTTPGVPGENPGLEKGDAGRALQESHELLQPPPGVVGGVGKRSGVKMIVVLCVVLIVLGGVVYGLFQGGFFGSKKVGGGSVWTTEKRAIQNDEAGPAEKHAP